MLTPVFELTQDRDFLIVWIQAPYAKASEVEVDFEDNNFLFYSKPYYLRLKLPGKVVFSEEPQVKYDFDKKTFQINVPKANKGEVFEGLDLISFLLAPQKAKSSSVPHIEVLESSQTEQILDEEIDWSVEQTQAEGKFGNLDIIGQQCGFASMYNFSVFKLKEEVSEIFDVCDPHKKSAAQCTEERIKVENEHFNEDHYIADLYEDEEIQHILQYKPDWENLYAELEAGLDSCDSKIQFTSEEKDRISKLPRKEYLLDKSQLTQVFLGLVDILFAYAYDKRTTQGESTVESAWTINKISATLSWLEVFSTVQQVSVSCVRRSLIYPLHRHFELSLTVLEDVRKILILGRKYVLKCLLEIHEMFCNSEPRYILNDLFIADYIVWMQTKTCSSEKLKPLANVLEKMILTKGDVRLRLVDIESFAAVAWISRDKLLSSSHERSEQPEALTKLQERNQESFHKKQQEALTQHMANLSLKQDQTKSDSHSPQEDSDSESFSWSSDDSEWSADSDASSVQSRI